MWLTRIFCRLLFAVLFFAANPLAVKAGVEDDWSRAISKPVARDARSLMESILSRPEEPDYAARAALWLGQYEYTTGRVKTALPYFRQAASLSKDPDLRSQAAFWAEHCRGLFGESSGDPTAEPSVEDSVLPSATIANASQFMQALALGDAEIRAGRPRDALRRYLALEEDSRQLSLVGPLAYRVALVVAFARSAGESDPLFSWRTLDAWLPELARSPERGLITALRRRDETLPPPLSNRESKVATDFAELPGAAPKKRRVANRSFPAPDFSPPDSLQSDYRTPGKKTGRPERRESLSVRPVRYVIQLGAYRDRDMARREMERLTLRGLSVRLVPGETGRGDRVYRIQLGRPASRQSQEEFADRRLRGIEYQIVPVDS